MDEHGVNPLTPKPSTQEPKTNTDVTSTESSIDTISDDNADVKKASRKSSTSFISLGKALSSISGKNKSSKSNSGAGSNKKSNQNSPRKRTDNTYADLSYTSEGTITAITSSEEVPSNTSTSRKSLHIALIPPPTPPPTEPEKTLPETQTEDTPRTAYLSSHAIVSLDDKCTTETMSLEKQPQTQELISLKFQKSNGSKSDGDKKRTKHVSASPRSTRKSSIGLRDVKQQDIPVEGPKNTEPTITDMLCVLLESTQLLAQEQKLYNEHSNEKMLMLLKAMSDISEEFKELSEFVRASSLVNTSEVNGKLGNIEIGMRASVVGIKTLLQDSSERARANEICRISMASNQSRLQHLEKRKSLNTMLNEK